MQRDDWSTVEWKAAEPADLGMDQGKLSELESVINSEYSNINGIVIVKNGYLAFERYYHGYGPDDAYHMTSVTKSVLSALIGIAIDNGCIKNTEQKVLEFFPEYGPDHSIMKKQEITIQHLLTMTAPYSFEDWKEPMDIMCMQPDWVAYILDMLGQKGSPGVFKYSSAGAHLLSAILTRSTGKCAREFANENLFRPIGMKEIPDHKMDAFGFDDLFGKNVKGWVKDPAGNSTGGWGLTLTPRDMARFGFLYLNRGTWDHRQVVPRLWVEESTTVIPGIGYGRYQYGYLWWLYEKEGLSAYLALGDGGNVICCIPKKDLVVAIASEFTMNPADRWFLIQNHILPVVGEIV